MDWIDSILLYTAITFGLLAIGIGLYIAMYRAKFKIRIEIRRILHGRKLVEDDMGRLIKDGEGNRWLKRLKGKGDEKLMPVPPSEAQEMDAKGRIRVAANLGEDGAYQYVVDSTNTGGLDTLSSNERMSLANQIRKANERKGMSWKDYIPMIANGVIVLLILVCFMIFFNEVISPTKELANAVVQAGGHFEEAAKAYERIDSDIQQLIDEQPVDNGGTETPPS